MKLKSCVFVVLSALILISCNDTNQNSSTEKPLITKLGTIDCDLVETTPVVFKNKVYRFEYVRIGYEGNTTGDSYFRFIDHETGEATPAFAHGYHLGSAFVHGDSVIVTGVNIWDGERIQLFVSTDLHNWTDWTGLELLGNGIFNTSMCIREDDFVLMYEIGKPEEETGKRFTARFAISEDLHHWEVTPDSCNYAKDRYTAPHCLRYLDGYFYNFYLEVHDGFEMRVVRSKDLIHWEASTKNPVLKASAEDKIIANEQLTPEQRNRIKEAKNINNSDIDFCEFDGRLIINYSWGDQHGKEFLAEAVFEGTQVEFLLGWF
jgi:hypothetical protein